MPSKIVSNSEAEAYQRCKRLHWFAFGLSLRPKDESTAINTGVVGHEVLEAYYRAKMAEQSHRDCVSAGLEIITKRMGNVGEGDDSSSFPLITQRFLEYAIFYEKEPFRVLDIEGTYSVPLENGTEYALTLDLLVEFTSGRLKGQQAVYDHKWAYNFWTLVDLEMNAQIPKYLWAVRKLGSNAEIGIISQIRTRKVDGDENKFRRNKIEPSVTRMENLMDIHATVAEEIAKVKTDRDFWKENATPSISKLNCQYCPFRTPCSTMLEGKDPSKNLYAFYERKKYGYEDKDLRRTLAS